MGKSTRTEKRRRELTTEKNAESKDGMSDTNVGFDRILKCPRRPIQLKLKGKVAAFSQEQ